jgi:hypothetical protein
MKFGGEGTVFLLSYLFLYAQRASLISGFSVKPSLQKQSAADRLCFGLNSNKCLRIGVRSVRKSKDLLPAAIQMSLEGSDGNRNEPLSLNKYLTAASKERRQEEQRRNERKNEVIIGKTSAKRGVSDYAIDPEATRQQYLAQVPNKEREIMLETEKGLESMRMVCIVRGISVLRWCFKPDIFLTTHSFIASSVCVSFIHHHHPYTQLQLEEADEAFSKVYCLKPTAYLFAAGIAKFYLNDVFAAGEIFARNAQFYEARFEMVASEERIWRDACYLKLFNSLPKRDRKKSVSQYNVPEIPPFGEDENEEEFGMKRETRKVIRIARDLFDASVKNDTTRMILSRAKLRATAGDTNTSKKYGLIDPKQWKLNSWVYLGLHYDVMGQVEESRKCIKNALMLSGGGGNSNDIIRAMPMIHMSQRDWFDDDDLDVIDDEESSSDANILVISSQMKNEIRQTVQKMTISDIQEYLVKRKGIKMIGSKAELQQRLLSELMQDAQQILGEGES